MPPCNTYVEPYGGGMNILLNREPSPIEVYNDLNGRIVNLFKVLREKPLEFLSLIYLTPCAREEYEKCYAEEFSDNTDSDLEKARRVLTIITQSMSGRGLQNRRVGWGHSISSSNQAKRWANILTKLILAINRIKDVQIENRPALDVIKCYDTENTLFYCDPPYVLSTRSGKDYEFEMTDEEHVKLSETLHAAKGKVALSGYNCKLMEELYFDWRCVKTVVSCPSSKSKNGEKKPAREECLWMNYEI